MPTLSFAKSETEACQRFETDKEHHKICLDAYYAGFASGQKAARITMAYETASSTQMSWGLVSMVSSGGSSSSDRVLFGIPGSESQMQGLLDAIHQYSDDHGYIDGIYSDKESVEEALVKAAKSAGLEFEKPSVLFSYSTKNEDLPSMRTFSKKAWVAEEVDASSYLANPITVGEQDYIGRNILNFSND